MTPSGWPIRREEALGEGSRARAVVDLRGAREAGPAPLRAEPVGPSRRLSLPLTVWWRLRGIGRYLLGRKDWGSMERRGFQAPSAGGAPLESPPGPAR